MRRLLTSFFIIGTSLGTLEAAEELWRRDTSLTQGSLECMQVGTNGGVVLAGSSIAYIGHPYYYNSDYYVAKYSDSHGGLIWSQAYYGASSGYSMDRVIGMAQDAAGNVLVTGTSTNSDASSSAYTAKYAANDGTLLWQNRSATCDSGNGIVCDSAGDVVVAGHVFDNPAVPIPFTPALTDLYVSKHSGATGGLLWETRYNVSPAEYFGATSVVLDRDNNVFVRGYSQRGAIVAKFDGLTGTLSWLTYTSASDSSGIAVDPEGNIVLTGTKQNDIYTAKYAAVDGALLWERVFGGSALKSDYPAAVSIDKMGDVVVAGYSTNEDSVFDAYTGKYRGSDGAVVWEQHHHLSNNRDARIQSLHLDAVGNVCVSGIGYGASGSDYFTFIYGSADGSEIFNAPMSNVVVGYMGAAAARSVFLPNGNVMLAGGTNAPTDHRYFLALYAAPKPVIRNLEISDRTDDAVTLSLDVNPAGKATTGSIEYRAQGTVDFIKGAQFDVGSGTSWVPLATRIAGLAQVKFEWRAVFTNSNGTTILNGPTFVPGNQPPVANLDGSGGVYTFMNPGTAVPLPVLENDTDADGDALQIVNITHGAHGSVSIVGGGSGLTYLPDADFHGSDSLTYTISDGAGGLATARVVIIVIRDFSPAITSASGAIANFQPFCMVFNAMVNPKGFETTGYFEFRKVGTSTYTRCTNDPLNAGAGDVPVSMVSWTQGLARNTTYQWRVVFSNVNGETIVNGGQFGTSHYNNAPYVYDDHFWIPTVEAAASPTTLDVLKNDQDLDDDVLRISNVTPALHGTVSISHDGTSLKYLPEIGFAGEESFTYTVYDGFGGTRTGVARVFILNVPSLTNPTVASVFSTSANVTAMVVGKNMPTTLMFEYRPVGSTDYSVSTEMNIVGGWGASIQHQRIEGLLPNQEYEWGAVLVQAGTQVHLAGPNFTTTDSSVVEPDQDGGTPDGDGEVADEVAEVVNDADSFPTFGTPGLDGETPVFAIRMKSPAGKRISAIALQSTTGRRIIKQGDALAGETVYGFGDPAGNDGAVVPAKLKDGARGLLTDSFSGTRNAWNMVAREGALVSGNRIKEFRNFVLNDEGMMFWTASTTPRLGPWKTPGDDALFVSNAAGAEELLSRGEWISSPAGNLLVKSFIALKSPPKLQGDGRYNGGAETCAHVTFSDGRTGIVRLRKQVAPRLIALSGNSDVIGIPGAVFRSFGIPAMTYDGNIVFRGGLLEGTAKSEGLFLWTEDGINALFRSGDSTGDSTGSYFSSFGDPTSDANGNIAFLAKTKTASGARASEVLYYLPFGQETAERVAGANDVLGANSDARIAAIESFALPHSGNYGPVFTVKLRVGKNGVTTRNHRVLSAVDSDGKIKLLSRTGEKIADKGKMKTIKQIIALNHVSGSQAAARTCGETSVVYGVRFTDNTEAVLKSVINAE